MKLSPDMNYNMDTNILTIATVFCYVLFVITLQSVAAIMTIIAAGSTAIWNVYKIVVDRRQRRHGKMDHQTGEPGAHQAENIKSNNHE